MRLRRCERGQTSVLVVGLALVVAMLVAVVVDASAAYLQRQGLHSLADGAALAAADAVAAESVYTGGLDGGPGGGRGGGPGKGVAVDPGAASAAAAAYLRSVGAAAHYPGIRADVRTTGDRVVVRLAAPLDLPLPPPGGTVAPVVVGTAAATLTVAR